MSLTKVKVNTVFCFLSLISQLHVGKALSIKWEELKCKVLQMKRHLQLPQSNFAFQFIEVFLKLHVSSDMHNSTCTLRILLLISFYVNLHCA